MNDIYISGPIYNNHDVCPASDYVCSFAYEFQNEGGAWRTKCYDLYVVGDGNRQVAIWREDSDHPSSYGAATFECLIQASKISELNRLIVTILFEKGKFVWSKNSK